MNSKKIITWAVIGLTAGLFLSAQAAPKADKAVVATPKKETVAVEKKEVATPKKETVATEKKEVVSETDVKALKKEVADTETKEVAMMKCSKDASDVKAMDNDSCKKDEGCGCGDKKAPKPRKGAAQEAVGE